MFGEFLVRAFTFYIEYAATLNGIDDVIKLHS